MIGLHFQSAEIQHWLFDPETPLKELHQFIHLVAYRDYGNFSRTIFGLVRTAIDIRISENAEKSAENLTGQTNRLVSEVAGLVLIAEDQKQLAAKLEQQTNKLIRLTWGLVGLSVALFAIASGQTKIMLKENAQSYIQHIDAGQSKQAPSTNK